MSQVQRYEKEKDEELLAHQMTGAKEYAFDYFFEKSQQERAAALEKLGISDGDEDYVDEDSGEEEVIDEVKE